jgi:hypothetical protein
MVSLTVYFSVPPSEACLALSTDDKGDAEGVSQSPAAWMMPHEEQDNKARNGFLYDLDNVRDSSRRDSRQ